MQPRKSFFSFGAVYFKGSVRELLGRAPDSVGQEGKQFFVLILTLAFYPLSHAVRDSSPPKSVKLRTSSSFFVVLLDFSLPICFYRAGFPERAYRFGNYRIIELCALTVTFEINRTFFIYPKS